MPPANAIAVVSMPDPEAQMEQILAAIEGFKGNLLVGTLPPIVSAFSSADRAKVEKLRQRWMTRLESLPRVQLLDFAAVVEEVGVPAARATGNGLRARVPYSPRLFQRLAVEIVRKSMEARRTVAKVVAVDCDNTLWGGVVGEAGFQGIQLGPDGEGRSFQLFQQHLLRLKQPGLYHWRLRPSSNRRRS